MIFNSFEFVLFFPIVTFLYFIVPHKFRAILLLVASCIFYMMFKWEYIFILLFTIIIDYFAGILIDKSKGKSRKWALSLSIIANLSVLGLFKYYYFAIDNVNLFNSFFETGRQYKALWNFILPIGLSFHTFQAMSYTIEVYRGNQKVERNFMIFSLYVMFYPQLVAGPIERPQNVLWQFYKKNDFDFQKAKSGLRLMLWGIFKKVVIADNLSTYVDHVYGSLINYQGLPIALAVLSYSVIIYCDFSGYSDIAIGSARIMGFKLMKNFDRPYASKNISEFWNRWHISLSTWFRDYLYIPLGGNRVSPIRRNVNLFVVFMASGIWHGASWNFVIWGGLHGIYLIFGNMTKNLQNRILGQNKIADILHNLVTILLVTFAWIFFRSPTLHDVKLLLKNLVKTSNRTFEQVVGIIGPKEFIVLSISILILLVVEKLQKHKAIGNLLDQRSRLFQWSVYYLFLFIIISFGYFGDVQFIYFQF